MALPSSLRPRRGRSRHLLAAACLATVAGVAAGLTVATGPVAPLRSVAQVCVPGIISCPTSSTSSSTSTTTRRTTTSSTKSSSTTTTRTTTTSTSATDSTSSSPEFIPQGTPLPTLPPPSPGSPPQPPALEVQKVQLDIASALPVQPGGEVLVQVTLEAARGSDTYAVPNAPVRFSIAAQSGSGAFVDPSSIDSGDTGVVVVKVQTGDRPGDTVLHAVSGNASNDLTIPSDPATPSPTATSAPGAAVGATHDNNAGPSRPLLVAGLSALLAAMVGGYVAALAFGKLPNPLQRRVWGRRASR